MTKQMKTDKNLNSISILPKNGEKPTHLLLALHGWGANAQDLAPLASMFNLPGFGFIFPDAPFYHPQVPEGRAWYALETQEYLGLPESRELLRDWLESLESVTGVPLNRTFMAGFSQGGAMTLDVGLTLPLAGLCSLSGYLHYYPEADKLENTQIPAVLIVHGKQDMVVPLQAAQQARDELKALGVTVNYQEFEMGHEIQPEVLTLMEKFIKDN
jgi:phospholipase/carboxylesterase